MTDTTTTTRPCVFADPFYGAPELVSVAARWATSIYVTYGVTDAEKARYAEAVRIYGLPDSVTRVFPGNDVEILPRIGR